MSRAEDLLEEVIVTVTDLTGGTGGGVATRAAKLLEMLESQRGKFFYKTLTGVPNVNKCKKAALAAAEAAKANDSAALEEAMDRLQADVEEMVGRSDAPSVVLT